MGKMVIEVPEELAELGKAMAEQLAEVQRTMARQGGGKAVDYALVEQAVWEAAGRTEREAHRAILQSLDIDVPAVVIGKERYTRVGRCEDKYHTMAGSVSVERSLYRKSGERGGQPGAKVVDAVSVRAGVVGDGWLPHTARVMAHEMQQGTSREAEAFLASVLQNQGEGRKTEGGLVVSRHETKDTVSFSAGAMGMMGPAEILAHPLTASLVVLNGCRSGQGQALPGAGLMGLTRAWIGAGARSVLATRWDIPDGEGEALMIDFYRALRAHPESGPASALQQAQSTFLKNQTSNGQANGSTAAIWSAYFVLGRE